jgi:hypothetical protein
MRALSFLFSHLSPHPDPSATLSLSLEEKPWIQESGIGSTSWHSSSTMSQPSLKNSFMAVIVSWHLSRDSAMAQSV